MLGQSRGPGSRRIFTRCSAVLLVAASALGATAGVASARAAAVSLPSITTSSLPAAYVGIGYSIGLQASGGSPAYSWSVASGALPGGFLLSSGGLLQGLAPFVGSTAFVVRVTDSLGNVATRSLTLQVTAPPPPAQILLGATLSGAVATLGLVAPLALVAVDGPIAGIAGVPGDPGAFLVTTSGKVTGLSTPTYGSVGHRRLSGHVTAIAVPPHGGGYWLLSSTGHVYGFGTAHSIGSTSRLTHRVVAVGIAAAPRGRGYFVALSDGRVETFGSATDYGGVDHHRLRGRIVGIAALASGGYVTVSSSGRVYRFGPAHHVALPNPLPPGAVGVAAAPGAPGYWVVAADGTVYPAGSARPLGSLSGGAPLVAVGATS